MTEQKLKILLLGPVEVTLEGKPVHIKRRQNRALLFYLAAQTQPVTREAVCALFWPEESEERARKNLREALSRIRTELGLQNILITDGELISLNSTLVWVDYLDFERTVTLLLSSSEMNASATLPEWMVLQLKQAMTLCRTTRIMQGVSLPAAIGFDNWLEFSNQAYNYTRMKVLDRLVDHYISGGNLEEALLWLGKGLETNPLDEELNFLTLICLRDMGKTRELVEYDTYLEKLYQQQQEPFPDRFTELRKSAEESSRYAITTGENWPEGEKGELKFIGRETELDQLGKALRRRGIVLLRGEAGIGKTRLLKQFYSQQPYPPRLLYCRGNLLSAQVAFNMLIQGMRQHIKPEEMRSLSDHEQAILLDFYHKTLQGTEGPKLPQSEDEWLPVLDDVFFAALKLMEIAAAHRPVLFILDESKWADQASISLIAFMIEHKFFEKNGLLVIVTPPEIENRYLNYVLQQAGRAGKLETVDLGPFTNEEIRQYIERVVGKIPSDGFVNNIQRLTGGNPFFLIECVRATKISAVDFSEEDNCTVSTTIKSLVQDKITRLKKESISVLQAVAILGRQFSPDILEEMVSLDSENILAGLEELTREGFLKVNENIKPAGGYEFKHDVEREIVIKQLSPGRRRDLNLKAAMALLKRRGNLPEAALALAGYYESAGEPVDAVNAWLEGGKYARTTYSSEDAYHAFGKALELIGESPAIFPETMVCQVVNEWGDFAHEMDDEQACEKIYRRCLDIGDAKHSLLLTGTGYSGLGRTADFLYEYKKAEEYFQRAIFYLSQTKYTGERIKALSRLGIMKFSIDEYFQALALFEEALKLSGSSNEPDMLENRVYILTYTCTTQIFLGNTIEASKVAAEIARDSILVKRRSAKLQTYALLAMTHYFNGQPQQAIQVCREMHALADNLQIRFWQSLVEIVEALAYFRIGNLDKGWYYTEQIYNRELNYPHEKLFMQAIKIKGDFYRLVGDFERARDFYLELINSDTMNYETIESRYSLGVAQAEQGNMEEALHWLNEAIKEAANKGLSGIELCARMTRLLLSAEGRSVDGFEHEGQEILEEMTRRGMLDADAYTKLLAAVSAGLKGEHERELKIYQELEEYLAATENVWMEFQVLKKLITLSGGSGQVAITARKRVNELLRTLATTATLPAVKGPYQKLRNKWKGYVNDTSTLIVYKSKGF